MLWGVRVVCEGRDDTLVYPPAACAPGELKELVTEALGLGGAGDWVLRRGGEDAELNSDDDVDFDDAEPLVPCVEVQPTPRAVARARLAARGVALNGKGLSDVLAFRGVDELKLLAAAEVVPEGAFADAYVDALLKPGRELELLRQAGVLVDLRIARCDLDYW